MDATQVTRYFNRLYAEGDEFEMLFTHPEERVARVKRTWGTGADVERILDEIGRAESAGYNVYASVMPLGQQATGQYDRIWIDQDNAEAPWPFESDPEWQGAPWPKPTTLVRTSEDAGGWRYQAIWLLTETVPEAEGRDTIRRLSNLAGADGSVHDPRRVFRVPGVMNAKRGVPARLMDTTADPISLEAFNLPAKSVLTNLLDAEVNNPAHVLGEWLDGVTQGDRARKAYVCARFLKSCQVTYADAGAIMKLGAMRCEPPFSDRELEHCLNSAYH